jgi:hypothetical protein
MEFSDNILRQQISPYCPYTIRFVLHKQDESIMDLKVGVSGDLSLTVCPGGTQSVLKPPHRGHYQAVAPVIIIIIRG